MTRIGISAYAGRIMPILFIVFGFLLSNTPVFAGGDVGGGGGPGVNGPGGGGDLNPTPTQNPFALFQFVMELVTFAFVFYLALASNVQRRRIVNVAAIFMRKIGDLKLMAFLRMQTATKLRALSLLLRLLAITLIVIVSLSTNVYAVIGCCDAPDPFMPFEFVISVIAFGLAIWVALSPRTKHFRSGIYQTLTSMAAYRRIAKAVASGIAVLLVSFLAIVPVVSGGDDGVGGFGVPANPFAPFEFLAQVIIYSTCILALLSPRKTIRANIQLYNAITSCVRPIFAALKHNLS